MKLFLGFLLFLICIFFNIIITKGLLLGCLLTINGRHRGFLLCNWSYWVLLLSWSWCWRFFFFYKAATLRSFSSNLQNVDPRFFMIVGVRLGGTDLQPKQPLEVHCGLLNPLFRFYIPWLLLFCGFSKSSSCFSLSPLFRNVFNQGPGEDETFCLMISSGVQGEESSLVGPVLSGWIAKAAFFSGVGSRSSGITGRVNFYWQDDNWISGQEFGRLKVKFDEDWLKCFHASNCRSCLV